MEYCFGCLLHTYISDCGSCGAFAESGVATKCRRLAYLLWELVGVFFLILNPFFQILNPNLSDAQPCASEAQPHPEPRASDAQPHQSSLLAESADSADSADTYVCREAQRGLGRLGRLGEKLENAGKTTTSTVLYVVLSNCPQKPCVHMYICVSVCMYIRMHICV